MSEEDLLDAEQFRLERGACGTGAGRVATAVRETLSGSGSPWRAAHPWVADPNTCASPCQFLGWICRTPASPVACRGELRDQRHKVANKQRSKH